MLSVTNYFTSAYSGYSNRIRGILTAERAKQEYGVDYALNWTKTQLISCELEDILKNAIKKTDQFGTMLTHRLKAFPNDDLTGYGPHLSKPEQRFLDLEYERIPESVRNTYLPYFGWLDFQPCVADKVASLVESFKGAMPIGLHCRNAFDWDAVGRQCPIERYREAVDLFPKELPIYLVVHSPGLIDVFKEFYGNRIIVQPDKEWSVKEKKHTQGVAVESLVLSKLNMLVADELSTFVETSWWLGGCTAKVIRINKREICK